MLVPDLAGYAAALDQAREVLGSEVTFYWNPLVTWPGGTSLDPSGQPYDPTVLPTASAQSSYTTTAKVSYRMQLRNQDSDTSAIGRLEHTPIIVNVNAGEEDKIAGASTLSFHGDLFQIHSMKRDQLMGGYTRILVYAQETDR